MTLCFSVCCIWGLSKLEGKPPAPSLLPEDIPTASFGILSIHAYRENLFNEADLLPAVMECATLNLLTMQADERHNTPSEYDAVMEVIRGLVPYFTREYLMAYVARFVKHTERSTWDICNIESSTSIFVSRLRLSNVHIKSDHKYELIDDIGGKDVRLEDEFGADFQLPKRPKSCSTEKGKLEPPMDYSLRECSTTPVAPTTQCIYCSFRSPSPVGRVLVAGLCLIRRR